MSNSTLPTELFASTASWERWLDEHHERSRGLWLKIAKQGSGATSVSYAQALEVALLFGWIDGQKGKLDERFFLQKFTPRAPHSRWSKINREKAIALMESGRMRPSGLAAVERAKANGRWDAAYDGHRSATVPPDLQAALDAQPAVRAVFDALDRHNRYAILHRVQEAKKPETRARRIATFVEMLAKGETLHPRR